MCVCVLKADFGLRNSFNNKIVVCDLLTEYALHSTANKSLIITEMGVLASAG